MHEAADLYEQFTGHDAKHYDTIPVEWPDTALKVGTLDGLLYTTVRDGVEEHYIHKIRKRSRPTLAVSHDGRKILPIGGKIRFTDRGFIDQ